MTSAVALSRRIERAANSGRSLRLTPGEADLLRAVHELSEAHVQAHALDADAGVNQEPDQSSIQDSEAGQ